MDTDGDLPIRGPTAPFGPEFDIRPSLPHTSLPKRPVLSHLPTFAPSPLTLVP
jgi:hypothetical protein